MFKINIIFKSMLSKYILVGIFSYILDFIIFLICLKIFLINWFFSAGTSFIIVSLIGFHFYFNHVFSNNSNDKKSYVLLFFLIANLGSLILNQFILYLGIEILDINILYVKICSSCIVILINYILRYRLIFR